MLPIEYERKFFIDVQDAEEYRKRLEYTRGELFNTIPRVCLVRTARAPMTGEYLYGWVVEKATTTI